MEAIIRKHDHHSVLEMSNFPPNPGPARNKHRTSFGWAQHQAQHSALDPASSPAVYPFSIRPPVPGRYVKISKKKNRAQHRTGTAPRLDGPSIKPSIHSRARHQARRYILLALGCSFWVRQHRVHAAQKPCRARFWTRHRAFGLELDISGTY